MKDDLGFIHRFVPGTRHEAAPLLLLHGTGGNEDDLIALGAAVAPGAALLSPRGKVLEHGMPRFFSRLAEGVFDEREVEARALELADFVQTARTRYDLPAPIALGFSNGANIAAAILLLRPAVLAGAILMRAMVTLRDPSAYDIGGKPVLMLSGASDPIVPPDNAARLAKMLAARGANLAHRVLPVGHQLSQADLTLSREWIAEQAGVRAGSPLAQAS